MFCARADTIVRPISRGNATDNYIFIVYGSKRIDDAVFFFLFVDNRVKTYSNRVGVMEIIRPREKLFFFFWIAQTIIF